jgi:thiamine biosynthesis lipoprotein
MGVQVRLVVWTAYETLAKNACATAFARIAKLDAIMSDYRPDSELMRLCARSGSGAVRVSADLYAVLERAQTLAELSGGAFDVTAGPCVRLWRQARRSGQMPASEALDQARALTDWSRLQLDADARTAQLTGAAMQLDLGGIAKGYAGDCALQVLRRAGITRAMYVAGGDIVVGDAPPGRAGWTIDIAETARQLTLANAAVSTSGDTEQFVMLNGKRYSHIVDPRTALGLTSRIAATVVAPNGLTADGLATAACVLGPSAGQRLVSHYTGTAAYIRQVD